ncbi:MAG: hypothetical protein JNN01_25775 [Opitutaceae bacterium]|nr:hypothetical protein [Opitutaceae bacterium]
MFFRIQRRISLLRALICYHLVAFAQMLSPAAAADPASRIDPPAWSHAHSQQELQSYGSRVQTPEHRKVDGRRLSQVQLRRLLNRQGL